MKMNYSVAPTSKSDLEFIYFLFEEAIEYQKNNNYTAWQGFDKNALINDMESQLQYKIMKGREVLCVFSICYSDKIIWRGMENGDAIYIHRMVVNPEYRGQKQFEKVLMWAIKEARKKRLSYIRIDTWADNPKIVAYYTSFGFRFIEYFTTPNTDKLPVQHRNLDLALLQFDLNKYFKKA